MFLFDLVGIVEPKMMVETVPINPYFADMAFKVVLEIMFVGILVHLFRNEVLEIRSRMLRRRTLHMWARGKGGSKTRSFLFEALIEHFWSGEEPVSNLIDAVTIGLGIEIVVLWFYLVKQMGAAEDALKNLHRPEGMVAYDDTDHDVWSEYHYDVTHVENLIMEVVQSMVRCFRSDPVPV